MARPRDCYLLNSLPYVEGIDVSAFQWKIAWDKVAASGKKFAILRAVEGATPDKRFVQHAQDARSEGLIIGAYAFFHPGLHTGAEQAGAFLRQLDNIGGFTAMDLGPCCDIETFDKDPHKATKELLLKRLSAWVDIIEHRVSIRPLIYAGAFWHFSVASDLFRSLPLWTPDYTRAAQRGCPGVPKGWQHWSFWQRSGKGRVPGVSGDCDLDVFRGDEDQLRAFIALSHSIC